MDVFGLILMLVFTFFLAYQVNQLFRINEVAKYRMELMNWVFGIELKSDRDVKEWKKRLEIYDRVSFNDMCKQWYKPLESFYPEYEYWKDRTKQESRNVKANTK